MSVLTVVITAERNQAKDTGSRVLEYTQTTCDVERGLWCFVWCVGGVWRVVWRIPCGLLCWARVVWRIPYGLLSRAPGSERKNCTYQNSCFRNFCTYRNSAQREKNKLGRAPGRPAGRPGGTTCFLLWAAGRPGVRPVSFIPSRPARGTTCFSLCPAGRPGVRPVSFYARPAGQGHDLFFFMPGRPARGTTCFFYARPAGQGARPVSFYARGA